jgi:hypothetical protein
MVEQQGGQTRRNDDCQENMTGLPNYELVLDFMNLAIAVMPTRVSKSPKVAGRRKVTSSNANIPIQMDTVNNTMMVKNTFPDTNDACLDFEVFIFPPKKSNLPARLNCRI